MGRKFRCWPAGLEKSFGWNCRTRSPSETTPLTACRSFEATEKRRFRAGNPVNLIARETQNHGNNHHRGADVWRRSSAWRSSLKRGLAIAAGQGYSARRARCFGCVSRRRRPPVMRRVATESGAVEPAAAGGRRAPPLDPRGENVKRSGDRRPTEVSRLERGLACWKSSSASRLAGPGGTVYGLIEIFYGMGTSVLGDNSRLAQGIAPPFDPPCWACSRHSLADRLSYYNQKVETFAVEMASFATIPAPALPSRPTHRSRRGTLSARRSRAAPCQFTLRKRRRSDGHHRLAHRRADRGADFLMVTSNVQGATRLEAHPPNSN